jgi:NAD(P)-dependent dehydrogenase (short-subunit alcohol dehydrogenase family)
VTQGSGHVVNISTSLAVRVNAVSLGVIRTPMTDRADPDAYAHIDGGQVAGH